MEDTDPWWESKPLCHHLYCLLQGQKYLKGKFTFLSVCYPFISLVRLICYIPVAIVWFFPSTPQDPNPYAKIHYPPSRYWGFYIITQDTESPLSQSPSPVSLTFPGVCTTRLNFFHPRHVTPVTHLPSSTLRPPPLGHPETSGTSSKTDNEFYSVFTFSTVPHVNLWPVTQLWTDFSQTPTLVPR